MSLSRRGRQAVAAAFALTLLAAACGGDDGGDDPAPSSTTEPAATSTSPDGSTEPDPEPEPDGPDVDEAEALAESLNLTIEDMGDGWQADDSESDSEGGVSECYQDVDLDAIEVAQADSPQFTTSSLDGSQGQVVQTSTIVLDEEASAEAIMAEIGDDRFADCVDDVLVDSIGAGGGQVIDSGIVVVEDQGGLGDASGGLAGAISLMTGGNQIDGQLALYFIRTDNVITGVQVLDLGGMGFEETLGDLLDLVDKRHAQLI